VQSDLFRFSDGFRFYRKKRRQTSAFCRRTKSRHGAVMALRLGDVTRNYPASCAAAAAAAENDSVQLLTPSESRLLPIIAARSPAKIDGRTGRAADLFTGAALFTWQEYYSSHITGFCVTVFC